MTAIAMPSRAEIEALMRECLARLNDLRGPQVPLHERRARALLKQWQAQRLALTHTELLQTPRYAPAARFFLEDLYGPKDHRLRDRDVARVLPKLLKVLPQSAQWTLAQALQMDALSEDLDADMAALLSADGALGHEEDLDRDRYVRAYRRCGRPEDRVLQLDLVMQIGQSLDQLTRVPMLSASLRLMRKPAEMAGLSELHDFLQRGFHAFAHMKGSEAFLQQIVQAERELMLSWLQPQTPPPDGCAGPSVPPR